jgi:hypothetical protein
MFLRRERAEKVQSPSARKRANVGPLTRAAFGGQTDDGKRS